MGEDDFQALVQQWSRKQRRENRRAMEIVACILNQPVYGFKKDGPVVTADQLLGPDPDDPDAEKREESGLVPLGVFLKSLPPQKNPANERKD